MMAGLFEIRVSLDFAPITIFAVLIELIFIICLYFMPYIIILCLL
jgi:hypothetical protein